MLICAFCNLEQARKELEAEQQTSENGGGDSTNDNQPCTSSDAAGKKAENGHVVIDPACYAVQGVFYRCPEIGRKELCVNIALTYLNHKNHSC